jgi:hypothetical protein
MKKGISKRGLQQIKKRKKYKLLKYVRISIDKRLFFCKIVSAMDLTNLNTTNDFDI